MFLDAEPVQGARIHPGVGIMYTRRTLNGSLENGAGCGSGWKGRTAGFELTGLVLARLRSCVTNVLIIITCFKIKDDDTFYVSLGRIAPTPTLHNFYSSASGGDVQGWAGMPSTTRRVGCVPLPSISRLPLLHVPISSTSSPTPSGTQNKRHPTSRRYA